MTVVVIMSPITPHICHELWGRLVPGDKLEDAVWPEVDADALEKSSVRLVIQVNGKLRGKIDVAPDETEKNIEALALEVENVSRHIDGKSIRKVILVPEKLVNFVVG